MHAALRLVYRYRQLAGKCETGAGLSFDEIGELTAIEAAFAGETQAYLSDRMMGERDFARAPVDLSATLIRRRFRDSVTILDLAPGGFVCEGAPFLQDGDRAEIAVRAGADGSKTYRFMAEVAWTRDRANDCVIGFRFVGIPIEIRRLPAAASPEPAGPGAKATRPAAAAAA